MFQNTSYDLVVFDCDGTLVNSEIIACNADAETITKLGYPITAQEVSDQFSGVPQEKVFEIIEQRVGRPLPPDLAQKSHDMLRERYHSELQTVDGARELVEAIHLPKCIASSSAPDLLETGLKATGLYELFAPNIFPSHLVKRAKPDPDVFLYAAQKMGVAPEKCIVIEDSVTGVTGAVAAGMTCVGSTAGLHCGEGHAERLRAAGAAHIVTSLADIMPLIFNRQLNMIA